MFTELPSGGTKVEVWVENATPGTHGIHLHEKGDCSAPDASSAGAHFNPAGNPHAGPSDPKHHNGDWGNITVGADGKGHLEETTDMLTVKPGPNSVVGKAVVFHEKADDLKTQPYRRRGRAPGSADVDVQVMSSAFVLRTTAARRRATGRPSLSLAVIQSAA